ncbi:MAG: acyl--CoA ligase [Proteobacteria bacterium]|nr:acyl--CoA ligase [Candidatus Enterousia onthequi]
MNSIDQILKNNKLIYLTATDQNIYADIAVKALKMGCQLVLLPEQLKKHFDLSVVYEDEFLTICIRKNSTEHLDDFSLAMFTSGSTEDPKIYAFNQDKIKQTLSWYKKIYGITDKSMIVSPMPTSYNFSFIAGVLNAENNGAKYFYKKPEEIMSFLDSSAKFYDKVVILANPIILDMLSEMDNTTGTNVLIDSGGAPLSTKAIQIYRSRGFDIREGYGLTETASLTHFDIEGTDKSVGTVGFAVDSNISTELVQIDSKPMVKLISPNIGRRININGQFIEPENNFYQTTDIARFDADGRLVLLGRSSDIAINGMYPKDSMEFIADILQQKCVLVQHLQTRQVNLRFFDEDMLKYSEQIKDILSDKLSIKRDDVIVECIPGLLHSLKLQRKKNA